MKRLVLILICGLMASYSFFALKKITVHAVGGIGVKETFLGAEDLLNEAQNDMQIYGDENARAFIGGAISGDPSYVEESEKLIDNGDILTNMDVFPEHDNNNGCGMVAMSILTF